MGRRRAGRAAAQRDGPWLILWSKRGLRGIDLLTVDEASEYDELSFEIWRSSPARRLAGGPVLLPVADGDDLGRRLYRDLVWLVEDGAGLALATVRLPLPFGSGAEPRIEPLRTDDGLPLRRGGNIGESSESGAWSPADAEGALFLAAAGAVFQVSGDGAAPWLHRLLKRNTTEAQFTGLGFLPRGANSVRPEGTTVFAPGVLFVACREPSGPALLIVDGEQPGGAPIRCDKAATRLGQSACPA